MSFTPAPIEQNENPTEKSGLAWRSAVLDLAHRFWQAHPSFIIISAALVGAVALFANEVYLPHAKDSEKKIVEIVPGLGSRQIATFLEQKGVIRSSWAFLLYASLTNEASSLKSGLYIFTPSSIKTITETLVRGDGESLMVTIPEGWTNQDIIEGLRGAGVSTADTFSALINSAPSAELEQEFPFLADKPAQTSLEGYLFPDTYRIEKNAAPPSITRLMLINFDKKVSDNLQQEIKRQQKSLHDVIIMASMIEKEVVSAEDRKLVSGILWKRLKLGVPLQVDATIVYSKRQKGATLAKSGKISSVDTQIDSPYNTYKYRGLPVGPIANPGLSAIRAAVYPKDSPYLYYLSTPSGETIFSRTFEEHTIAKQKYLK